MSIERAEARLRLVYNSVQYISHKYFLAQRGEEYQIIHEIKGNMITNWFTGNPEIVSTRIGKLLLISKERVFLPKESRIINIYWNEYLAIKPALIVRITQGQTIVMDIHHKTMYTIKANVGLEAESLGYIQLRNDAQNLCIFLSADGSKELSLPNCCEARILPGSETTFVGKLAKVSKSSPNELLIHNCEVLGNGPFFKVDSSLIKSKPAVYVDVTDNSDNIGINSIRLYLDETTCELVPAYEILKKHEVVYNTQNCAVAKVANNCYITYVKNKAIPYIKETTASKAYKVANNIEKILR